MGTWWEGLPGPGLTQARVGALQLFSQFSRKPAPQGACDFLSWPPSDCCRRQVPPPRLSLTNCLTACTQDSLNTLL